MQGAPEIVLSRCVTINSPSGAVIELDDATRATMLQCFESAASTGMRLLGPAECPKVVGLARYHFLGVSAYHCVCLRIFMYVFVVCKSRCAAHTTKGIA